MFHEADLLDLREKSVLLTGYMEFLLKSIPSYTEWFTIITPDNPVARGCQLSLFFHKNGRLVFEQLKKNGIIVDWREPNVIRAAPVPLYNSYSEVYKLYIVFRDLIGSAED